MNVAWRKSLVVFSPLEILLLLIKELLCRRCDWLTADIRLLNGRERCRARRPGGNWFHSHTGVLCRIEDWLPLPERDTWRSALYREQQRGAYNTNDLSWAVLLLMIRDCRWNHASSSALAHQDDPVDINIMFLSMLSKPLVMTRLPNSIHPSIGSYCHIGMENDTPGIGSIPNRGLGLLSHKDKDSSSSWSSNRPIQSLHHDCRSRLASSYPWTLSLSLVSVWTFISASYIPMYICSLSSGFIWQGNSMNSMS